MANEPGASDAMALASALTEAAGALERVRSLLTQLPDPELASTFATLVRLRALAEGAALATLIEAIDRGVVAASDHPRPAAWARTTAEAAGTPMTTSFASSLARSAEADGDGGLTRLLDAARAGRIGTHETARAVREFRALRPRIPAALWDVASDALVDHLAAGAGVRELAAAHEAIVATYGDEGEFDDRQRTQRRLRSFGDFRRDASGMFVATLRLDPESHARLDPVLAAHSAPTPEADGAPDPRDRYARRADVVLRICTHVGTDPTALPESRPGSATRAQVLVTVPLDQLVGATEPGEPNGRPGTHDPATDRPTGRPAGSGRGFVTSESGHPLGRAVLDALVCDGALTPVVVSGEGHVLDVGRRFRLATARQRAALVVRDGGCTFPGCTLPPSWCEAHHIRPWELLGRTDLANLALLCGGHHRVVHARHYTATVTPDGVVWRLDPRDRWPDAWTRQLPAPPMGETGRPWRELRIPLERSGGRESPTRTRRWDSMRQ